MTDDRTSEMRSLRARGFTQQQIADFYGISRQRVHQILPGRIAPQIEYRRIVRAVSVAARCEERSRTPHGTTTRYGRGCRCDECREANLQEHSQLLGRTPPVHGRSGYVNYGCRCSICRAGHRSAMANEQQSGRQSARGKVARALKAGIITRPDECPRCGSSRRIEAHHPDHTKPLEIEWLCSSCHKQHHQRLRLAS